MPVEAPIRRVIARAYTIPTDAPEADGTFSWTKTTIVVVEIEAAGTTGLGYSYTDAAAVSLLAGTLRDAIAGQDAMDPSGITRRLERAVRNVGRSGLAATAISAVDAALWDLKARLLGLPLAQLLGVRRNVVPIYGSGGFTSYDDARLCGQLADWVGHDGCRAVKMKVGSQPDDDPRRMELARRAIGDAELFVDANGALTVKQAIAFGRIAAAVGVTWFEEPVSSDDLRGLCAVRTHLPAPMELAAGEYAFTIDDVRRTLETGAVDVQQVDVTRVGGISGFLAAATLCDAFHTDLSGHCAPALHLHAACAAPRFRHLEWFHDHVRIERMLFDGAPVPSDGVIAPDFSRPGHGLAFRAADAAPFLVRQ
ncbi:mandelate racemase [Acetobacteraceae bacterium KSS8]|uniref:Mandelate racemase n=1 Tax=Endosaccharibacter trunci TaxID=2812733 RepID=A0ABT1WAV3_9PROT|nr:mandelate racemase [Acetobacteraceae bacterium KSS8]